MLAVIDERLSAEQRASWTRLLLDHDALERRFQELMPPLPACDVVVPSSPQPSAINAALAIRSIQLLRIARLIHSPA